MRPNKSNAFYWASVAVLILCKHVQISHQRNYLQSTTIIVRHWSLLFPLSCFCLVMLLQTGQCLTAHNSLKKLSRQGVGWKRRPSLSPCLIRQLALEGKLSQTRRSLSIYLSLGTEASSWGLAPTRDALESRFTYPHLPRSLSLCSSISI